LSLFANGLEGYDASQKNTPTKGSTNIGGAKVFYHPAWRTPQGKILFLNPLLEKAVKELPVLIYTLNKIDVKDGQPVFVRDRQTGAVTGNYSRSHTGLMLYAQFFDDPKVGERIKGRLVEAMKPAGFDLTNYVEVASNIPGDQIKVLETLQFQDPQTRQNTPLRLSAAVILSLPSGPTSGFWQMKNTSATSRTTMSAYTSANPEETDNLPL
jgi:hypothetical protein